MTEGAIDKGKPLVWVGAVPSDEELHRVGVTDHRAGRQSDLTHAIDVVLRDQILEPVNRAQGQHERHDHAETREDRARHEVRREDCRVPARDQ